MKKSKRNPEDRKAPPKGKDVLDWLDEMSDEEFEGLLKSRKHLVSGDEVIVLGKINDKDEFIPSTKTTAREIAEKLRKASEWEITTHVARDHDNLLIFDVDNEITFAANLEMLDKSLKGKGYDGNDVLDWISAFARNKEKLNPRAAKMKKSSKAISAKIKKLIHEGYSAKQASAIAFNMSRKHKQGNPMKKKELRKSSIPRYSFNEICLALSESDYTNAIFNVGREAERLDPRVYLDMIKNSEAIGNIYNATEGEGDKIGLKLLLSYLDSDEDFYRERAIASVADKKYYKKLLRYNLNRLPVLKMFWADQNKTSSNPRKHFKELSSLITKIEKELKRG